LGLCKCTTIIKLNKESIKIVAYIRKRLGAALIKKCYSKEGPLS
jgi:hypothetical protein